MNELINAAQDSPLNYIFEVWQLVRKRLTLLLGGIRLKNKVIDVDSEFKWKRDVR